MKGNAAIIKCTIPSFVADFVQVISWIDEDGKEFLISSGGNVAGGNNLECQKAVNPTKILPVEN